MVDGEGEIKILDFGLAKEIGDLEQTSSIGEIVGSPLYLSPEQIQGQELGVESDIYQLGILLFQALTGAYPFADTSTMNLVLKHLNQKPGSIAAQGVKVPGVVEFVVARALSKRKQVRFRSAAEIAQRLHLGKVPALAAAVARVPRALRSAARFAAALAFLAGAYTLTYGSRRLQSVVAKGKRGASGQPLRPDPLAEGLRPLRSPPGPPGPRSRLMVPAPASRTRSRISTKPSWPACRT